MNELLPIGTIVKCKDIKFPLIIIGYGESFKTKTENEFEYTAYPYPIGFVKKELIFKFKPDSISEIIFEGYKNDDFSDFLNMLNGGVVHE